MEFRAIFEKVVIVSANLQKVEATGKESATSVNLTAENKIKKK
jgi:hypothetical protein